MSCTCETCTAIDRWAKALKPETPEAKEAFEEMLMRLEAAETDAVVAQEVFAGRWPGSVEILERSLSIARESEKNATCAQ